MFKIKYDGSFTQANKDATLAACQQAFAASQAAVNALRNGSATEAQRRAKWFSNAPLDKVREGVTLMQAVFNDDNRTVTFVDVRGKSEKFYAHRGSFEQATLLGTLPMTAADYAYVKTVGGGCQSTKAHVGSGMRVMLGENYLRADQSPIERAATIYHELTHKVLGTKDHAYEPGACAQLALQYPDKAVNCADNWTYFVLSYVHGDWGP